MRKQGNPIMHDTTSSCRRSGRVAGLSLALLLGGMGAASAAPTVYEVRHHFDAANTSASSVLTGSLAPTLGRDGKLYGLKIKFSGTAEGGVRLLVSCALYRHDPASGVQEELGSVQANGGSLPVSRGSDLGSMCSAPVEDARGDWYWNTFFGGAEQAGQLLRYRPGQGIETVFSFPAAADSPVGSYPQSVLTLAPDGTFYGTTARGGAAGNGTIFAFVPEQGVQLLHTLERDPVLDLGTIRLGGTLVLSEDGKSLFGAFSNEVGNHAVANAGDTLYAVDRTTGVLTRLARTDSRSYITNLYRQAGSDDLVFTHLNAQHAGQDGFGATFNHYLAAERRMTQTDYVLPVNDPGGGIMPIGLTPGADGNLYGVFPSGGSNQASATSRTGSIFRLKGDGTYEVIHMLAGLSNGKLLEGAAPGGGLTLAPDGRLYGVTDTGGEFDQGTLFAVTPGDAIAPMLTFTLVASGDKDSTVVNFPEPHTIVAGQWAKFRWATVQADDCEGGGDWPAPGAIPASGELEVMPATPGEYRYVVSCRNTAEPTQRFTAAQYLNVVPTTGEHIEAGNGGGALAWPVLLLLLALLGLTGNRNTLATRHTGSRRRSE